MRTAVIDLGTNTCNLLVAGVDSTNYKILHQSKQLVKLGDNKITKNKISKEATERTIQALSVHNKIIRRYKADKVHIIATSAVRSADNNIEFCKIIKKETGLDIRIISGEEEAELIFKGVLLAFGSITQPSVILDIGGGSNEIILAHGLRILKKESRPTGMSRVINSFHLSDPVSSKDIQQLQHFFLTEHRQEITTCRELSVQRLIGCSGAFDTIADLIDEVSPGEKRRTLQEITLKDFNRIHQMLISSTRNQRLRMKGMDTVRVDLIVPAVIFIEFLISQTGIKIICQTDYALREGVIYKMLRQPKGVRDKE